MTKHPKRLWALALVCAATSVEAYRMIQNTNTGAVTTGTAVVCDQAGGFTHWNATTMDWYLNESGDGAGMSAPLQAAMTSWKNVPNASYVPNYAGTTSANYFAVDGTNSIVWQDSFSHPSCGSCLALTQLVLQPGQVIVEADITFQANYPWNTNGSDYDVEAVAAHEIGHTLGIHHTELTSTPRPTMYAFISGAEQRSLEADDKTAVECAEARYLAPAGLPGSISASPIGVRTNSTYTVSWGPSSGTVERYELQRHRVGLAWPTGVLTVNGTTTHYVYSSGSTSADYEHRVRACHVTYCSPWRTGALVFVNGYQ